MTVKSVVWHDGSVCRADRNLMNRHKSGLLLLTGLSAAGKSTIARGVEKELFRMRARAYVLDGDNLRHGINNDLGFSRENRKESLRRMSEISKLFVDAGIVVLAAFIAPYREDRDFIRSCFDKESFFEVYVKCSIEECKRRDPKGQYKKALAGIISNYTGISSPYEEPEDPDLAVNTETSDLKQSVEAVIGFLKKKGLLTLGDGKFILPESVG
ncbi:MAG: adenylyl-sulfate kinase [Nitrospiraceae bacterium]|nr:adenylyl-sulfate kinase [Nitrospiraceae bacterium]